MADRKITIEVSGRHIHLSQEHLEHLFGKGFQLTKIKDLSQSTDFAAKETLKIMVGEKFFENIRVAGPVRPKTQVEISLSDAFKLGVEIPVRESGKIEGSPGVKLIGPNGEIELPEGLIAAKRHLHMNPEEAKELKISDGDLISVEVKGDRGLVFDNIFVRVREGYGLFMHIDTDEANAAGIPRGGEGIFMERKN